MKAEHCLRTEQLEAGYGKTPLIRQICLHVRPGEIVTLIGPNGGGKSTILKTVAGHLRPLGGLVWLQGEEMSRLSEAQIARQMAVVMTEQTRPELMTCREVVALGRYPYTGRLGILSGEDKARVEEALELVHGTELAERMFGQLSDGQRQRILLARAVCQQPRVIVLDEPTSFLDIRYKLELLTLLKELVRQKQVAVLLSLHELDLAQRLSDYVVCVNGRAIERCGRPEEIFVPDYMEQLYGITKGSYQARMGTLELEAVKGEPEVFVIGGNGNGIPVYRWLQRRGVAFAAGVIHENDQDYPVARALAARLVTQRAFEPVEEAQIETAARLMDGCKSVICCLEEEEFGTMNALCRRLVRRAEGKLISPF